MIIKKSYRKEAFNWLLLLCAIFCLALAKYLAFYEDFVGFYRPGQSAVAKFFTVFQYDFILVGAILVCADLALRLHNKLLRLPFILLATFILLNMQVDCASKSLFNMRLLWYSHLRFANDLNSIVDFMIYFSTKVVGRLIYCSVLAWLLFCCRLLRQPTFRSWWVFWGNTIFLVPAALLFFAEPMLLADYKLIDLNGEIERSEVANVLENNKNYRTTAFSAQFNSPQYAPKYGLQGEARPPKNVIFIMVESLNTANSRYLSGLQNLVPKFDRLAQKSLVYANYFSNNTASAECRFSILLGHPYQNWADKYREPKFYPHNFVDFLQKRGVRAFLYTGADNIGNSERIFETVGFDKWVTNYDAAYNGVRRYIFNSVDDNKLYAKVLADLQAAPPEGPFFTMVITTSSHQPYVIPGTEEESYEGAIKYTDDELYKFINMLKEMNYFENGIVMITGDHHAMQSLNKGEIDKYGLIEAKFRVPLIIYGKDIEPKVVDTYMDHSSLGPLIEYLQVGEYEVNQFQADPLNPDLSRIIIAADERPQWFFLLDPNGQERKFHYDGDVLVDEVREKMNNPAVNWAEYVKYLAWLRQNF